MINVDMIQHPHIGGSILWGFKELVNCERSQARGHRHDEAGRRWDTWREIRSHWLHQYLFIVFSFQGFLKLRNLRNSWEPMSISQGTCWQRLEPWVT